MKERLLSVIILLACSINTGVINGQIPKDSNVNGIQFQHEILWQQVVAKAMAENKYIFVDCYTTWCGPCKQMDRDVYSLDSVANIYNQKFICIKMQMDTSANDNESIKSAYADAHRILVKYKIGGFPSFLFFTPDGRILSRGLGLKSPAEFIAMGTEATDPSKNYYVVMDRSKNDNTNASETSWLARQAILLGYVDESASIAKTYMSHVNKDSLFTESNIAFMAEFTKSVNDWGVNFFFHHQKKIDSVMKSDDYSEHLMQDLIVKDVYSPAEDKARHSGKRPNWKELYQRIRKRFGAYYANRVTIATKCSWAGSHNDNSEYVKYMVLYVNNYASKTNTGFWPAFALNKYAWSVFKYSNDPDELKSAQSWSGRSVLLWPLANSMDTYANILYKLKKKEEAIMWEENAAKLTPGDAGILSTLQKMKSDQPNW